MRNGFFGFRLNIDQAALLFKMVLWHLDVAPVEF